MIHLRQKWFISFFRASKQASCGLQSVGDQKRTEAFIAALVEQSTKSVKGGVEEKARIAFEASVGSTADYGEGKSWGDVGLYFLYAGYNDGI